MKANAFFDLRLWPDFRNRDGDTALDLLHRIDTGDVPSMFGVRTELPIADAVRDL